MALTKARLLKHDFPVHGLGEACSAQSLLYMFAKDTGRVFKFSGKGC